MPTHPVPVEVLRALQDVRRIVHIEGDAIRKPDHAVVLFRALQMARPGGENGW